MMEFIFFLHDWALWITLGLAISLLIAGAAAASGSMSESVAVVPLIAFLASLPFSAIVAFSDEPDIGRCYVQQQKINTPFWCSGDISVENKRLGPAEKGDWDDVTSSTTFSDSATEVTVQEVYADLVVGNRREENVLIETKVVAPTRYQCARTDVLTYVNVGTSEENPSMTIGINAPDSCTLDVPEMVRVPSPFKNSSFAWDESQLPDFVTVDGETNELVIPVYSTDMTIDTQFKKVE